MSTRRSFIKNSATGIAVLATGNALACTQEESVKRSTGNPLVVATWDSGIAANQAAWQILDKRGKALDAVEAGVMVTEASINCCVGLGGNPDRDGIVTLDACIMDDKFNCGSVAALERIKHPISVARKVMENTPHVMLVGEGAQQFALSQGFKLEPQVLSDDAKEAYQKWLEKSEYKPRINIENSGNQVGGENNHDTIGMIALDADGNLSGSCTTSGMGFKMRGRVGDSPIIGSGLYVDNEVGAAAATGQGEDVIRISGSHLVVEFMRQGSSPEEACKKAVDRIAKIKGEKAGEIQVCFIAINIAGEYGAYSLQSGFSFAVCNQQNQKQLIKAKSYFS